MQDSESLKRFLLKEDIGELPGEEEVWEVPEPRRDNTLERGIRSTQAYMSVYFPVNKSQAAASAWLVWSSHDEQQHVRLFLAHHTDLGLISGLHRYLIADKSSSFQHELLLTESWTWTMKAWKSHTTAVAFSDTRPISTIILLFLFVSAHTHTLVCFSHMLIRGVSCCVCGVIKEQLLPSLKEQIPHCSNTRAHACTHSHTLISRLNMIKGLFHLKSVFLTLKQLYVCMIVFYIVSVPACISKKWKCCIAGLSRSYSSSHAPEELPHHAQDDGEETLRCWPPRAPAHSTGGSHTGSAGQSLHSELARTFSSHPVSVTAGHRDTSVVDAVMKRFPPPPGPDDRDPARDSAQTGNSESLNISRTFECNQPQKSCRPTDQPSLNTLRPTKPNNPAVISDTPLTPGLVIGHGDTHLSGREHTLFSCKGGSSFQLLQKFSAPFTLFWCFVQHHLRFPVVASKILS